MPLESGTTIAELDALNPTGLDNISQGDDHLRLIKNVLKQQFPGEAGQGFAIPITATETEINFLENMRSNVQDQIDGLAAGAVTNLFAPEGTHMLFYDEVPPVGWTIVKLRGMLVGVTNEEVDELIGTPLGGTQGGDPDADPVNLNLQHKHATKGHQLVISEMPSHSHFMYKAGNTILDSSDQVNQYQYIASQEARPDNNQDYRMRPTTETPDVGPAGLMGGGGFHEHGRTDPAETDGGEEWTALNMLHLNVIIAVKDPFSVGP